MPRVGFEPTISAGEWPKTYALDRAATGIGSDRQMSVEHCWDDNYRRKVSVCHLDHLISYTDCPMSEAGSLP